MAPFSSCARAQIDRLESAFRATQRNVVQTYVHMYSGLPQEESSLNVCRFLGILTLEPPEADVKHSMYFGAFLSSTMFFVASLSIDSQLPSWRRTGAFLERLQGNVRRLWGSRRDDLWFWSTTVVDVFEVCSHSNANPYPNPNPTHTTPSGMGGA